MTLAKAFPHLRFCIQDRPKTTELGIAVRKPFPQHSRFLWKQQPRHGKNGVLRCWYLEKQYSKVFHFAFSRLTDHLFTCEQLTTFLPHNPSRTLQCSYYELSPTTGLISSSTAFCCNCGKQPPHKLSSSWWTMSCRSHAKIALEILALSEAWHHPQVDSCRT